MNLNEFEADNKNAVGSFIDDMSQYYTGRATPMLLDRIKIKYYDETISIERCAEIYVASPELLIVRPWDTKILKDIERAIHAANIGLTPLLDGESIKVYLPKHTKEDDLKIFNLIKIRAEKAKISIRQNRKRIRNSFKSKNKNIDFNTDKRIQDLTDKYILRIDEILKIKKRTMKL